MTRHLTEPRSVPPPPESTRLRTPALPGRFRRLARVARAARRAARAATPLILGGSLTLMAPSPGAGQSPGEALRTAPASCPNGRVSRVFVDNHSVFDPASVPEDPRIRWAYRLANRIHVRTRASFIEDELLLESGDCYDPLLARESARILREFRFIADADAFSVPQPDGTRHLVVETRDEWTTKVAGDVSFEGGLQLRGLSLVEENFMGRGISLGAFYFEEDERRDVGGLFELPRLRGGNWDLATSASRTRIGTAWSQALIHPFVGEVGTFAFRQRAESRQDLFSWTLPPDLPWTYLVAPLEVGKMEITGARRFGTPGQYLVVGGGISREWVRPAARSQVEGVVAGSFDEREAVPDSISARLDPQLRSREATRLNLLLGVRRVRFIERAGLDALAGIQDVPVGRELLVSVGPSLDSGPGRDVFLRADLFGGIATASVVGQLHLSLEGRRTGSVTGSVDRDRTRDVLGEGHLFLYHQVPGPIAQTLVLHVSGQGGWRVDAPFQLTLGGRDGVRGYDETRFPGSRRAMVTVEDRFRLPSPFPDLVDLGATLFADLGRMHGGDAPFSESAEWRGTVGAGIRLGFPAGSASVIRFDLAFPVGPGAEGGPILILEAREWVGILDPFQSNALARSRRSGVPARFTGVNRTPASR